MAFKDYIIFALVVVIAWLWRQWRKSKQILDDHKKSTHYLERKIENVQLESIDAKLNPHLFKNILNSIQSHTYQSYYTIEKLSNVLDYVLYETSKKFVSPREEITFAKDLIEINRIKISPLFDLRIKIKIDEKDVYLDQKVLAPLLSVDLIENAFKHTEIQEPDAFISIIIELKGGYFSLTVSNKISGKVPLIKTKSGFGGSSLEKRLHILYKDRFRLERFVENDTFLAYLKIRLYE